MFLHLQVIQIQLQNFASNPRNEKLYNTRGSYNISIGKFNEGIVDYKKAIKLNQNYTEAYNNYAMALKDTMQWENALNIINKAININNKISILPDLLFLIFCFVISSFLPKPFCKPEAPFPAQIDDQQSGLGILQFHIQEPISKCILSVHQTFFVVLRG